MPSRQPEANNYGVSYRCLEKSSRSACPPHIRQGKFSEGRLCSITVDNGLMECLIIE